VFLQKSTPVRSTQHAAGPHRLRLPKNRQRTLASPEGSPLFSNFLPRLNWPRWSLASARIGPARSNLILTLKAKSHKPLTRSTERSLLGAGWGIL
jgi:hypothetical protein